MPDNKKSKTVQIGNSQFVFESNYYDGQRGDTKVSVNGALLIWVSGPEMDKFIKDMEALIDQYRI